MATQRTPQALNARPGMQININTPGLQSVAQPVNTAVQAEDTSRQYLASSNAIAQSIISFGQSLAGLGGAMAPKAQKQNDTLELLKAENMALQDPTPGVTLGDKFNTDMAQLGSPVDIDKVHLTYGTTKGIQIGEELSGTIATQYNEGSQGFQKGNFSANSLRIKETFSAAFKEAEGIPDELTKEAYRNSLLKAQDKLLMQTRSMDIRFAEESRQDLLKGHYSKVMHEAFITDTESRPTVIKEAVNVAAQIGRPISVVVDDLTKGVLDEVASGAMLPSELEEFLEMPLDERDNKIRDYVDVPALMAEVNAKRQAYVATQQSNYDNNLVFETTKALQSIKRSIGQAKDSAELQSLQGGLENIVTKMFQTEKARAKAYEEIDVAIESRKTTLEKAEEKRRAKLDKAAEVRHNELLKEAKAAQKAHVESLMNHRTSMEKMNEVLTGATPWSLSTQKALEEQLRKEQPELSLEEMAGIFREQGLPDNKKIEEIASMLNSPTVDPASAQSNTNAIISDVRQIASAIRQDETGRYRFNLHKAMRNSTGYLHNEHFLSSYLLEEITKDPTLLDEKNTQKLGALIGKVQNYRNLKVPDEVWQKVVQKTLQEGTYSNSFKEYLDRPETKVRASLHGFSPDNPSSITQFLKDDFENSHVKIGISTLPKNMVTALVDDADPEKATKLLGTMIHDVVLLDMLMRDDLPIANLTDEKAIQEYLKTTETELKDALNSSIVRPVEGSSRLLNVYTKDGVPIKTIDIREARAAQMYSTELANSIREQSTSLKGVLKELSTMYPGTDKEFTLQDEKRLFEATKTFKHLKTLPEDTLKLYAPGLTSEAVDALSTELEALHHRRFDSKVQARQKHLKDISAKYPILSTTEPPADLSSLMQAQKPLQAMLKKGDTQHMPLYMPGYSKHNARANNYPTLLAHLDKSVEEANSLSITPASKAIETFNILMDASGGLSVSPKGSDNFFGLYLNGTEFADPDSVDILRKGVQWGIKPEDIPATLQKDGATKSIAITPQSLSSLRASMFNKKAEKVKEFFNADSDDALQKQLAVFEETYPEKAGALVFLANNVGNNLPKVMEILNTTKTTVQQKKDALVPLVLGNASKAEKQKIVENSLLVFFGGLHSWAGYHLPKMVKSSMPQEAQSTSTLLQQQF